MDDLEGLLERQRIVDAVTELFLATDRRDWPAVIDAFTAEVAFDMSSLTGAPASRLAATEIAAGWKAGLAPLGAVHHQVGNFRVRVRGEEADAFCYGIALHHLANSTGRNTRTFVGSYDFTLRKEGGRWRIASFRFDVKFVDGNLELEASTSG